MSILASFVQFVMLQMGMAIAIIVIHVFFLQSPAKKNAFAEYIQLVIVDTEWRLKQNTLLPTNYGI